MYFLLPPATRVCALVEARCARLRQGAHICEGAYTRVGKACMSARGVHLYGEGAHACGGRTRLLGDTHVSGVGRIRLQGRRVRMSLG